MIINGKKKSDKAFRMMQLDYIYNTRHSNMYLVMTKKEQRRWENETIAHYEKNFTSDQLDEMIHNKAVELGFLS